MRRRQETSASRAEAVSQSASRDRRLRVMHQMALPSLFPFLFGASVAVGSCPVLLPGHLSSLRLTASPAREQVTWESSD